MDVALAYVWGTIAVDRGSDLVCVRYSSAVKLYANAS
jgi:hypothetical protein